MAFLSHTRALPVDDTEPARALAAWRAAAAIVRESWDQYLVTDRAARPAAFAVYATALDLEAEVADTLANLQSAGRAA
jgi:hypothetical protein